MVYPFSAHNYELRYWLAACGIDPDKDIRLSVFPPPYMAEYLADGLIDGFCAGEPWNSLAVQNTGAQILMGTSALWRMSPEKVLGMREDWADGNRDLVLRLIALFDQAAEWCDNPGNRRNLACYLAKPAYLDGSPTIIHHVLAGTVPRNLAGDIVHDPDFIVFHRNAATFPWKSQALWLYSQMVRWGQIDDSAENRQQALDAYRPDLFRRALKDIRDDIPAANSKVEGALQVRAPFGSPSGQLELGPDRFFDGRQFDPDRLQDYISASPVS
jgi:NitT/TauT family transport system ATP-binding protein